MEKKQAVSKNSGIVDTLTSLTDFKVNVSLSSEFRRLFALGKIFTLET